MRRLSVRKPGSSRPVAVPTQLVPDRGPASSPTLGSSCQLISTVTETKQGVTPRGKDAWARQILYYFTTVGPTGWCVAMPFAMRPTCDLSDAWVAHDARMTPTNENRTNE